MRGHTSRYQPTLVLLVALVILIPSLPVSGAVQEKPESSAQCLDGGWQSLAPQADPSTPFADQNECEAYAEQGGSTVQMRPAYEPRTNGTCVVDRAFFEELVPGQDFGGGDFSGCDLSRTSLIYANLTNANLSGSHLTFANLPGAPLTGAFWFNNTCSDGSNSDLDDETCAPTSQIGGRAPDATPRATGLPVATAPYGLGSVTLPDDIEDITELFDQLPAAVADEPRASPPDHDDDRVIAAYGMVDPDFGSPLILQAINFAAGDFFPQDFTVADFVASAADTASDYDAEAFGLDGTLAWVRAEITVGVAADNRGTPTASRTVYTLAWGESTSPWLFGAVAFSPEKLDALVSAFVATAKTQPATPAMEATPVALRLRQYPYPLRTALAE